MSKCHDFIILAPMYKLRLLFLCLTFSPYSGTFGASTVEPRTSIIGEGFNVDSIFTMLLSYYAGPSGRAV